MVIDRIFLAGVYVYGDVGYVGTCGGDTSEGDVKDAVIQVAVGNFRSDFEE